MSRTEEKQASTIVEVIIALIYAALVVGCTIFFQNAVNDFLDDYEEYVGSFVVAIFSFIFAMIFTGIGKGIIGFCVGKHFLEKSFVIFACIFLFIICLIMNAHLLAWWLTALCSILGTFISCIKVFFKSKVKKKVNEVRDLERDIRHQSIDDAKRMMKKFRGKL